MGGTVPLALQLPEPPYCFESYNKDIPAVSFFSCPLAEQSTYPALFDALPDTHCKDNKKRNISPVTFQ